MYLTDILESLQADLLNCFYRNVFTDAGGVGGDIVCFSFQIDIAMKICDPGAVSALVLFLVLQVEEPADCLEGATSLTELFSNTTKRQSRSYSLF